MAKRGFTLVELSIVLVIIGLLIGGILAAQSMISTAKIQSFVRQIQQFDVAVSNFQTKYNSLPGDSPAIDGSGNNNGIIEDPNADCTASEGESSLFWPDLQISGFTETGKKLPPETIGNLPSDYPVEAAVHYSPQIMIGSHAGIVACGTISSGKNYYNVNNYSNIDEDGWAGFGVTGALLPKDAAAFDTKTDDGFANSGHVQGVADSGGGSLSLLDTGVTPGTCFGAAPGTAYHITSSNYECSLRIDLLSQVGQSR